MNARLVLRANRLLREVGHDDTNAALEHMKRMETALKVLQTWAHFPPMDVREVDALCTRALSKTEPKR